MQQTITAIVFGTGSGAIQYAIMLGSTPADPTLPPWQGADVGVVRTFPGATQPPDAQTALGYVMNIAPWDNAAVSLPAGLGIIAAGPSFNPAEWFRWRVSGSQLIEKTKIGLRSNGNQILADSPITSTVQIGNAANPGSFTVPMTNGIADAPGVIPSGTPIGIVTSDSNFWSEPTFA